MNLLKSKTLVFMVALIFVSLQLTNCSKDVVVPKPCFTEDVLPIFVSKCSMQGCHPANGGHGYDFTNYEGVMKGVKAKHPRQSKVYTETYGLFATMPPNGKLTREELSTIKSWINEGASNSTNCSGNNCDTSEFTFAKTIQPIFTTNCVGCHNANSNQGNVNLSTYSGAKATVANNKLLGCIKHQSGFIAMPPSTSLSNCSITKIEKWITNGSPNN